MAPASINDLPIELHTTIVKLLLSLSRPITPIPRKTNQSGYLLPSYRVIPDWCIQSTSLFPYNVVSVLKLWRDILALIPECWTHVIFDVAKDPTPLLEAFSWSKDLEKIEVVVFNSNDALNTDKMQECSRVASITRALQSHIRRCRSIIFNLSYSASLPPPTIFFFQEAPHLEVLILDCWIDNIDLQCEGLETIYRDQQIISTSFPRLRQLLLTGFWFMYLASHANSCTGLNYLEFDYRLSLSISRFKFPREGCYSLQKFITYISEIRGANSKYFQDLSLSYTYDSLHQAPDLTYEISGNIHFRSVSKDFLGHLYTIARISIDEHLSFEECEIPKLKQIQYAIYLTVTNIIDNNKGTSLRHILKAWDGEDLTIRHCDSFNDRFLSWFASEIKYTPLDPDSNDTFPAENMVNLTIEYCDKFSLLALRELIRVRFEAVFAQEDAQEESREKGFVCNLDVTVRESGPVPRDEDRKWFEQNDVLTVHWRVRDDEGTEEIFSTESLY